jgi:hypothetical protein
MLKSNEKQSHLLKIGVIVQYSLTKWFIRRLWGCLFPFLYNFYIYIFYFVSQVLCICTDNHYIFSIKNNSFFFYFYILIILFLIWWGIGIASQPKLEVLKNSWFGNHNCFYYFLLFLFNYFIIATSHIEGSDFHSLVYVGKDIKPYIGIGIPTHTRVCLEVNTHTGILNYFINDKHIKDRVVYVPKDVYFGV